ncbi:MAG TPA: glycoside hydrolase family 88 protein [Chryseolinea sp.]|nr:glycoside hydrolase family 88 protein [Chryseolinea sp.]
MKHLRFIVLFFPIALAVQSQAQQKEGQNPPEIPYGVTTPDDVKRVMDKILVYVDEVTPFVIVNRETGAEIVDLKKVLKEATLKKSEYNIYSHEWGLAYTSMLSARDITGDSRYADYVIHRFEFLAKASVYFRNYKTAFPKEPNPLEHFLFPQSLDDTGSMCAAIIQALRKGLVKELRPEIDNSIDYILNKVHRLPDGTFARNRPMPNSVWVDDLYQGIPALAEMGKLTGDKKYYDEAVSQVLAFSGLLFDRTKGVCMHGWVEGMQSHPAFYWARANGWAILAISSLLDVLPDTHHQHKPVLELFRAYCHGLATLQSGTGFWHQLMDRNDSFLETSATAMFTYAFAHGIDKGWLDIQVYGPPALLGWNAIATKVNAKGQVEGTSAGTSMAFDAAFYYRRPVGTGPHGYGSTLIAGAAMYKLLKEHPFEGTPVMFKK